MKMKTSIFMLLATTTIVVLSSCQEGQKPSEAQTVQLSEQELIKRGKYLVTISGCNDCHSPKMMTSHGPVPDTTRLLSGHPMDEPLPPIPQVQGWVLFSMGQTATVGPWGASFSANLTPDDTGIGNWTYQQFETAIRKGKFKGLEQGRPLLPPMPWEIYRNLMDEDLKAMFAYLKSLPPVRNNVPGPIPPNKL
jgi:hypothetical protein